MPCSSGPTACSWGFSAITVLADRAFPSAELLGWFEGRSRWRYVMRLRADTWIHGTAAPMGWEVRRLRLLHGHCRGFRHGQLWECGHRANLVLARPVGITAAEPWSPVSNLSPSLDLVWAYGQRFCCEQLFRDQKSGIFQLERSGLRDPARIDRLLLVVAIAVLISALQGYAVSLAGERRRVDPHWKRGLSFARIDLYWLQQSVIAAGRTRLWPGCRSRCRHWRPAFRAAVSGGGRNGLGSHGLNCHRCVTPRRRWRSHDRLS